MDSAYAVIGREVARLVDGLVGARRAVHAARRAKTKRSTPAAFAAAATVAVARKLISSVSSGLMSPSGSFERAARWTTASNPARCSGPHVPNVEAQCGASGARHQVAALVEEHVEARDVVARRQEGRDQDRADIAVVAGDEDFHVQPRTAGPR